MSYDRILNATMDLQNTSVLNEKETTPGPESRGPEEDLNEKRLRRQAKNKFKRESNKRQREEDLRRKLYEPKDQRVRVVKRSEVNLILKGQQNLGSSGLTPVSPPPNISSDDFPSLGKEKSKAKRRGTELTDQNTSATLAVDTAVCPEPPSEFNGIKVKSEPNSLISPNKIKPTSTELSSYNAPHKISRPQPKRNAPIEIDVLSALKKCESPVTTQFKFGVPPKKEAPTRLFGNQLDASNPERKKGKVREIPKEKRPTQLKRVIIKEREEKRLAKVHISKDSNSYELCHTAPTTVGEEALDSTTSGLSKATQDVQIDSNVVCIGTSLPGGGAEIHESKTDIPKQEDKLEVIMDECQEKNLVDKTTITTVILKNPAKMSLHTRKFREYCDHLLSSELDNIVSCLVKDIVRFQDRLYFTDPIKARAKRRYVLGLREVRKYLTFKKIKLLIIAPDLERVEAKGGIDDIVEQLIAEAKVQKVPYVFAVGRKGLKKLTNKSFKQHAISCVGVFDYDGTEENFHALQIIVSDLRAQYDERLKQAERDFNQYQEVEVDFGCEPIKEEHPIDVNTEVVNSFLSKLVKELGNK